MSLNQFLRPIIVGQFRFSEKYLTELVAELEQEHIVSVDSLAIFYATRNYSEDFARFKLELKLDDGSGQGARPLSRPVWASICQHLDTFNASATSQQAQQSDLHHVPLSLGQGDFDQASDFDVSARAPLNYSDMSFEAYPSSVSKGVNGAEDESSFERLRCYDYGLYICCWPCLGILFIGKCFLGVLALITVAVGTCFGFLREVLRIPLDAFALYIEGYIQAFGPVGTEDGAKYRLILFGIAAATSVSSAALSIVGALGATDDDVTLLSVYWATSVIHDVKVEKSKVPNFEVYGGVTTFSINMEGFESSSVWGDVTCSEHCDGYSHCHDAMGVIIAFFLLNFLVRLPSMCYLYFRQDMFSDTSSRKFYGVVTGALSVASIFVIIMTYRFGCYQYLKEKNFSIVLDGYLVEGTTSYTFGPGYLCMWIALILEVPSLVVNLIVPSAECLDDTYYVYQME